MRRNFLQGTFYQFRFIVPVMRCVWIFDTFENKFEIKLNFLCSVKRSYWMGFSFSPSNKSKRVLLLEHYHQNS